MIQEKKSDHVSSKEKNISMTSQSKQADVWREKKNIESNLKELENQQGDVDAGFYSANPCVIRRGKTVSGLDVSPKGNSLIIAEDKTIVLIEKNTGKISTLPLQDKVQELKFQSEDTFYGLTAEGMIIGFERTSTGFEQTDTQTNKIPKVSGVNTFAVSQNKDIILGGSGGILTIFDKAGVKKELSLETMGSVNSIAHYRYPNGAEEILCACSDKKIILVFISQEKDENWMKFLNMFSQKIQDYLKKFKDVRTYAEFLGHEESVLSVAFSPCGTRVLSGGEDHSVRLYSKISMQEVRVYRHHSQAVYKVAFFSDGSKIISASEDRSLKIIDLELGEVLFTFQVDDQKITLPHNFSGGFIPMASGNSLSLLVPAYEKKEPPQEYKPEMQAQDNGYLFSFPDERTVLLECIQKNNSPFLRSIYEHSQEDEEDESRRKAFNYQLFKWMYTRDRSGLNAWDYNFLDETWSAVRAAEIVQSVVNLHLFLSKTDMRNFFFLAAPIFAQVKKGGKAFHKSLWLKALRDIDLETQKEVLDSFTSDPIPVTLKNYSFDGVKRILLTSEDSAHNTFFLAADSLNLEKPAGEEAPELRLSPAFTASIQSSWDKSNMNLIHLYYSMAEEAVIKFLFTQIAMIINLFVKFYHSDRINIVFKCLLAPFLIILKLLVLAFMLLTTVIPGMIRFLATLIFKILFFLFELLVAPAIVIKRILNLNRDYADLKDSQQDEYQGYIKLCYIPPREADNLFESVMSFPATHPIFQSDTLSILIKHRWKTQIKFYFVFETIKYLFILTVLSINLLWLFPFRTYSNYGESFTGYEIASISLDSIILLLMLLMFFQENYESYSSRSLAEYLGNVWSIMDLSMIYIGFLTMSYDLYFLISKPLPQEGGRKPPVPLKLLLSCYFFISWFRLLEFARGFSTTSTLFRLLIQVTKEMYSFLIVLFFMVIGAALSTFLLQETYTQHDPWQFFKMFYFILIGDFGNFPELDSSLNITLYFFIILFTTLVLVIVMLNLLIAIISDAFEKVMADIKQNDLYEKLHMIVEIKRKLSPRTLDNYFDKMENKVIYFFTNEGAPGAEVNYSDERLRPKIIKLEKAQNSYKVELLKEIEKLRSELLDSNKRLLQEIQKGK